MSRRLYQGGVALFFLFLLLSVGWISSTKAYATSPRLTLSVSPITATVGVPWSGIVAAGTDSLAGDTLTSTVEWSGASQSPATITLAKNGTFQVRASHTFTLSGNFVFEVSVSSSTGSNIVNTAPVTVITARLTLNVSAITAIVGVPWSGTIASGTDSLAGDRLTSTIEWGGASQIPATITLAKNGTFQVHASHTFTTAGTFPFAVSVNSSTNSGIVNTASVTVTTAQAPKLGNPCIFVRGKTAFLMVTFSDSQEQTRTTDYKATIHWGDGTTTQGTIWKNWSAKDFLLVGEHRYKHNGKFVVTLTITGPGGNSATKNKTIIV